MAHPEPSAPPQAAPPSRVYKIMFFASLALNLLFVGAIGGALVRSDSGGRGAIVRDLNFGPLTEALTKEDRADLRRAYVKAAPEMRDERASQREDIQSLLLVLRQEPFARDAVAAIFSRQMDRTKARLTLGQGMVLDLITGMTPEARAAFADRLEAVLSRGTKGQKP
jgi:uncharacterized membrane protein